jgi:hypothetical protein
VIGGTNFQTRAHDRKCHAARTVEQGMFLGRDPAQGFLQPIRRLDRQTGAARHPVLAERNGAGRQREAARQAAAESAIHYEQLRAIHHIAALETGIGHHGSRHHDPILRLRIRV